MEILAFDPFMDKVFAEEHVIKSVDIEMLLQNSDIVTIHTSLNDATYHLLNHERLGLMKRSAYLVNVARGPIVDEKALYNALLENRISGAACDVLKRNHLEIIHCLNCQISCLLLTQQDILSKLLRQWVLLQSRTFTMSFRVSQL